MGNGKQLVTPVVILDLKAAFDTLDHDLLLDVLEKQSEITDTAQNGTITTSNLGNLRILIEKDKSQPRQLDYSVPQGSIQETFLYISYASTLDEVVTQLALNRFADDHSVKNFPI